MCVIIIVPQGVKTPSRNELQKAFRRNHDGCGLVTRTEYYRTLNFDMFMKHVEKRTIHENMIIHFRWATHGSVRLANCHPFKRGEFYFAHNGILPIASYNDKTDSQILFEKQIIPCIKKYGWGSDELKCDLAYWSHGGSKFAMMHDGEIIKVGNYIEKDGCFYSNLNHIPQRYSI